MRIVVTRLKLMGAPRICVAGVDPDTGWHVRPTTAPEHPLTRDLLAEEGGQFALGALLELGEVTPDPRPPETEDHLFDPKATCLLGQLSSARYLELLHAHARDHLHTIFGDELVRRGHNYAIDKDCGAASLGILRSRRMPDLEVDEYGKLRLRVKGDGRPAALPVTDLRFVEADHSTIRTEVVADTRPRMRRGVEVPLMLGLTRAFQASGDDTERHCLQVNSICMEDRPLHEGP